MKLNQLLGVATLSFVLAGVSAVQAEGSHAKGKVKAERQEVRKSRQQLREAVKSGDQQKIDAAKADLRKDRKALREAKIERRQQLREMNDKDITSGY